jgi:hypothetical protein
LRAATLPRSEPLDRAEFVSGVKDFLNRHRAAAGR